MQILCILGRQKAFGLAELEARFGAENITPFGDAALVSAEKDSFSPEHFGSVVKWAQVHAELPSSAWPKIDSYLKENTLKHLKHVPESGKFSFGISCYGIKTTPKDITHTLLGLKRDIKKVRPVRIVENKSLDLNAAQIKHHHLTGPTAGS